MTGMRRVLFALIVGVIGLGVTVGGGYFWLNMQAIKSGPSLEPKRVLINSGSSVTQIADRLTEAGVLRGPFVFKTWARISDQHTALKAGEFEFPQRASVAHVLDILVSGETVVRKLTVAEGLTSPAIADILNGAEGLSGPLLSADNLPADGGLLPETYHYSWGDPRTQIVERMRRDLDTVLAEAWAVRGDDFPLNSPAELLVLASIVEKETALAEERPLVAAVFLNRLKKGMRLQSDPTVVYGLTLGKVELGRGLTKADLEAETPYNTYKIKGLPPSPIANPGRESIWAVVRPADSKALYFVADGSGGHAFAESLKAHNANVAKWRKYQRENGLR